MRITESNRFLSRAEFRSELFCWRAFKELEGNGIFAVGWSSLSCPAHSARYLKIERRGVGVRTNLLIGGGC